MCPSAFGVKLEAFSPVLFHIEKYIITEANISLSTEVKEWTVWGRCSNGPSNYESGQTPAQRTICFKLPLTSNCNYGANHPPHN
jgi:hypothetical protein